jgi:hypothetical protein
LNGRTFTISDSNTHDFKIKDAAGGSYIDTSGYTTWDGADDAAAKAVFCGTTFKLKDNTGGDIDASGFGTYADGSSGGVVYRVTEGDVKLTVTAGTFLAYAVTITRSSGDAIIWAGSASECRIYTDTTDLSDGDVITISSVNGMTGLNGNTYQVGSKNSDKFVLMTNAATPVAVDCGSSAASNLQASSFTDDDAGVITYGTRNWFKPTTGAGDFYYGGAGEQQLILHSSGGSIMDVWCSTSEDSGGSSTFAITGISQATSAIVTAASHGRRHGDQIILSQVSGMTEVKAFKVFVLFVSEIVTLS